MSPRRPIRVLVVEDDPGIARLLLVTLRRDGYDVRQCERASKAFELLRLWHPSVVLLDIGLPDADGRDVLRDIRAESDVPVIIVTARKEEIDRVTGLELGADDYILKPFSLVELSSRLRAVLRRARGLASREESRLALGALVIDPDERSVTLDDAPVELSNKEFEILRTLMERTGKVVSRGELAATVWGLSADEAGKTIDVHMSWLRDKLGDDARRPRFIQTVRGVGFRFLAPAGAKSLAGA